MSWHIPVDALRAYESGTIDATQQLSVETHLASCVSCQSAVAKFVDQQILQRTWNAIEGEIAAPPQGVIERFIVRLGVGDHNARLVAATPSLRRSWLLAVAAVLSLGVVVARVATDGELFFLAVAPLLPLAGIAAAYGPGIDPTYEIGVAAPMRSFRLLLIRAIAVLVSTIVLASVAAVFLPSLDWRAAAWLLPSLALATASLALATVVQPLRAAVAVGAAWLALVAGAATAAPPRIASQVVFGGELQFAVVVVGIGSALLLVARREELERGRHQ